MSSMPAACQLCYMYFNNTRKTENAENQINLC